MAELPKGWRILICTALVLAAASMFLSALLFSRVSDVQHAQTQGRKVSLTATCAAISGVIDAGRATILGGVIIRPREFERTLTKMGLPSFPVRKRSADAAAAAYGQAIAMRVEQATHRKGLTRKDGTLDCERIRQVGRAK
jgi:hypothetical protein